MRRNFGMKLNKHLVSKILLTAILLLIGWSMLYPVLWMISASLKFEADVFRMPVQWIPQEINWNNYRLAVASGFPYLKWYWNTFKTTAIVVGLVLSVSSMSGFAFAKLHFKGKNFIFALFISTLMIPIQVRVIPQFMMFRAFEWINTHWSITFPWIYNGFAIFLMRQFFMTVPDDLIEAAKIDGSSEYRTFFQIVIPLAKSSLTALTILSFTWGWNAYFGPLVYISDPLKQVLAVGIASFKGLYAANWAVQMAGATLALVPVIIVYLLAQRQFIEGIALSGVKG